MIRPFTAFCIASAVFLASCSRQKTRTTGPLAGGVHAGKCLRLNEPMSLKSLMPVAINELNSYHIASQIYEGLVRYDSRDLTIKPCLAEKWEISSDKKVYTFTIREGAYFHNDSCFDDGEGREVTAADVVEAFRTLCRKTYNNNQFDVTFKDRVEGANTYFDATGADTTVKLTGVEQVDERTVRIKLINPDVNFLNVLTMPGCYIYPKEALQKYGNRLAFHTVGTGPFMLASVKPEESCLVVHNPAYWRKDTNNNQLPYLDSISWTFNSDRGSEIRRFIYGGLDMIYNVPMEQLQAAASEYQSSNGNNPYRFDIFTSPALSTHYYGFNMQSNPFFSIRAVRQAFNYAIDRKKIAEEVLADKGVAASAGIVPYNALFEKNGFDYKIVRAYPYNPDSARRLLASVGYPNGEGLPPFNLELINGSSDKSFQIALEVQKMLKQNAGININISMVSFPEHIENVQAGKSDFFRYAWISDYADPESFLTLFYGKHVPEDYTEKSYINFCRFRNAGFDSLFEASRVEGDNKKRMKLLAKADAILMKEAAFMPLYYDENNRLVHKYVRNIQENPLSYIDLSEVYIAPPAPVAAK